MAFRLALSMCFFVLGGVNSLTIDTIIRDNGNGLWDPGYHGVMWNDIVSRVDKLVRVNDLTNDPGLISLPPNGICGPRAMDTSDNFTVDVNHRGPGGSILFPYGRDSIIVYIYTDVYNGMCMGWGWEWWWNDCVCVCMPVGSWDFKDTCRKAIDGVHEPLLAR